MSMLKKTIGKSGAKVLVVDDEDNFREAAVRVLKDEGYAVLEASDGVEGIEKAMKELPDIIVSDVHMPNMNGFMMVEELEKNEKTSQIPVIMMTGVAQAAGAWTSNMAVEYLEKPFSLDALVEAIRKVLKA